MESLKDTVTGKDLYNCVINCLIRSGLRLDKLASITTEGAPSLIGKYSGLVKLMNDKIKEDFPLQSVLSFHCIIQESLCKSFKTKTCYGSSDVCSEFKKSKRTETGNSEVSWKTSNQILLMCCTTQVRWLSMGEVLKRVWDLKQILSCFSI